MGSTQIIKKISQKQLFLIDSIGALVTALLTGFVLPVYENLFGMPAPILYILSGIAFGISLYSLLCYLFAGAYAKKLMMAVAVFNMLYCWTTLTLVFIQLQAITIWGWLYFMAEALIIITLAYVELNKAKSL